MEIMLAVALVVLLMAIGVISFGGWYKGQKLPEGARQFEGALRQLRADAASRGRRIRLVFDPDTLNATIVWEPQPLEEPGSFVPYCLAGRDVPLPGELVRVARCQRTGQSALPTLTYQDGDELASEDGKILQPVTFYPDGSYDSAIIELAGREVAELRIGRIELDGVNGTITLRILTPTEQQEQEEIDAEAEAL
jgi:type II secretory pathway pseudopilin PulG